MLEKRIDILPLVWTFAFNGLIRMTEHPLCRTKCVDYFNLLTQELGIKILAHPVCKMLIIQEPKK
jgi:hypothetical protein